MLWPIATNEKIGALTCVNFESAGVGATGASIGALLAAACCDEFIERMRERLSNYAGRKRDLYLKRVISFRDTEMIKVITDIRRCGKFSLMKLLAEYLRESGVETDMTGL